MPAWLLPAAGFVVVSGLLGVTSKLALTHVSWPQLILWATAAYAVIGGILLIAGVGLVVEVGTIFAILAGGMAVGALALLFIALGRGDASRVAPIAAAYPAVTVLLAALLLDEPLTLVRVVGTALVITGIILLSIEARSEHSRWWRGARG